MDSPEGHTPISAHSAEHAAEMPMVKQEAPPQSEPLHMEEKPVPHKEAPQMDELQQRKLIEDMLRAEAAQAVTAENPSPRDIPMEMPVVPPPEPESILHAPPQRKNFIVGMLTQVKDGAVHLIERLKKMFFSKKTEKPQRPTSFKNIQKPGTPISFKQQTAGA
ncbi:MAG: hypothetical protein WAV30_05855 [Microgenomates group bacterium]